MTDFIKGAFSISTDKKRLDPEAIHDYLSNHSYWAKGRTMEEVLRTIDHSLCFGVYHNREQIGFARVITDYTTFAYLADVYVLEPHRKQGLSRLLMEVILAHPQLQGLRRFMLATRDAHPLYEKFGFKSVSKPERWMEIFKE
jgi:GNAT superfamily N-acetyltransferase